MNAAMVPAGETGSGQWIELCRLDDLPRQGARVCTLAAGNVAVFRTADDRVFALDDRCPHKGGPLSQGIVVGAAVTCPLHGWTIEFETGAARAPDQGCTARHRVRVDAGVVWLRIDADPHA